MKMPKRIAALLISLVMVFSLFACENKKADNGTVTTQPAATENKAASSIQAETVRNRLKAVTETDAEAYVATMAASEKQYYSFDPSTTLEFKIEHMLTEHLGKLEEAYGKNIKVEMSDVQLSEMPDINVTAIKDIYGFDESLSGFEIEEFSNVSFSITVKGDKAEDCGAGEAYLIKENGNWKITGIIFKELDVIA